MIRLSIPNIFKSLTISLLCSAALPFFAIAEDHITYAQPGTLIYKDGDWIGTVNLFNLSSTIEVAVDIIMPPGDEELSISSKRLLAKIKDLLSTANISTSIPITADRPPLPFFHMQILIYPLGNGYAASCEGRLFEEITLRRVALELGTVLQGITWQKQILVVADLQQAVSKIEKAALEIVSIFIEQYQYYAKVKKASEKELPTPLKPPKKLEELPKQKKLPDISPKPSSTIQSSIQSR